MKKILVIFFTLISINVSIFATDMNVLESQQQSLGISDFISTSEKYTNGTLDGIDLNDVFQDAITGRIGNTNFFNFIYFTNRIKLCVCENKISIFVFFCFHISLRFIC